MRYFGITNANEWGDVNSKGFCQFIKEEDVVKFVKEKISLIEIEDAAALKEQIEEVEKMIKDNETDLENYCYKHSNLLLGDAENVVELHKVEKEENIYTYQDDGKNYNIEIFRGNFFVKEIKE